MDLHFFSIALPHIKATVIEMVLSLGFALLLSFILALGMLFMPWFKTLISPCFVVLQNLPMFVLAPFLLSLCGWGLVAIIIPTTLMLAFPLTLSLLRGLEATPIQYINYYRLHGASAIKTLVCIRLPFALPHFFSGLKIACASSASGAIAGEWAGAQKGLGVLLQILRRQFDTEGVFLCLLLILALSLIFYMLASCLETFFFFGYYGYEKTKPSYFNDKHSNSGLQQKTE